jgi:oxygen-independent coproporphyrinogen-3 oxidase
LKELSLYIHIPFCKTICLYCNFVTFAHKNKKIPLYIEALRKEIQEKAKIYKNYKVVSIYFGGGTPSQLPAENIEQILYTIKNTFDVTKDPEINIECNPESIDTEKLNYYKNIGINRISLGIQSFNKKTLVRIARPHDHLTIYKALESLQRADIKNFGADFIMGLPYQTFASFKSEIETALSYNPTHISAYFLSYDTKKIDLFIKDCPQEEEQIEMYEWLVKRLKKAGLHHYEVSNYAKPGYECLHNLRYWQQKEYLGFGVGAHSYINRTVWENTSDFEAYIINPLLEPESLTIDKDIDRSEFILLSLRTSQGINLNNYQSKYQNVAQLLQKAETYIESRHLTLTKESLQPTDKGFLIIDKITSDLI